MYVFRDGECNGMNYQRLKLIIIRFSLNYQCCQLQKHGLSDIYTEGSSCDTSWTRRLKYRDK